MQRYDQHVNNHHLAGSFPTPFFHAQHHTSDHYAFLDVPGNGRNRTTYYATLARLLFMEDTPARFKAFVLPLHQVRSCGAVCQRPGCMLTACRSAPAGLAGWLKMTCLLPAALYHAPSPFPLAHTATSPSLPPAAVLDQPWPGGRVRAECGCGAGGCAHGARGGAVP